MTTNPLAFNAGLARWSVLLALCLLGTEGVIVREVGPLFKTKEGSRFVGMFPLSNVQQKNHRDFNHK